MEQLKQTHDAQVRWRSFELRPAGGPPISPQYQAAIEAKRPLMEAMAREQYGLEINAGPFGVNSRPALVGAKYAEAKGVGEAFHAAVFQAYWQDGKNIADLPVLADLAAAVGLEREQFLAALDETHYQQAMLADVQQAFQYGLNGVPALVFNNKYLVSGAQPYALLAEVAEKVLAEE